MSCCLNIISTIPSARIFLTLAALPDNHNAACGTRCAQTVLGGIDPAMQLAKKNRIPFWRL